MMIPIPLSTLHLIIKRHEKFFLKLVQYTTGNFRKINNGFLVQCASSKLGMHAGGC